MAMEKLLNFLAELTERKIYYQLQSHRAAIMVAISVPGEMWEVEFFSDGQIEVEIFRSDGVIGGKEGEEAIAKLLSENTDS